MRKGRRPFHIKAMNRVEDYRYPEAKGVVADMLAYQNRLLDGVNGSTKYTKSKCLLIDRIIIKLPLRIVPERVDRKYMKEFIDELNVHFKGTGEVFVYFFVTCIKNGLYNKEAFEAWNDEALWEAMLNSVRSIVILNTILASENPINDFVIYTPTNYRQAIFVPMLNINGFLKDFLTDMLYKVEYSNYYVRNDDKLIFYYHFIQSFGNLPIPEDIWGFTPNTFKQQIRYFSEQPSYNLTLGMLKRMYLLIIEEYQEGKTPFTIDNGVTANFVKHYCVTQLVKDNYRTVDLKNKSRTYEFDKWLVDRGEDYSCLGIGEKGRLYRANFEGVPVEFKDVFKRWFMNSSTPLRRRILYFPKVKVFLQYLAKRRETIKPVHPSKSISFDEVVDFVAITNKNTEYNRTLYIKEFLQFLYESKIYPVDMACIKYLPAGNFRNNKNKIVPIEEEDYRKMLEGLKKLSKIDTANAIDKIAFAVFIILSLSELRISSILALTIDDVKEYGKGQFCITALTKTSRGHKKTFGITPFIYKVLQSVIDYTSRYRENAPKEVKRMVFITSRGNVVNLFAINRIFGKVCLQQNIPCYTTGNLRKTYMTNVARQARRKGRSIIGLEQLFDHKSTETTLRFYAKFDEEEILMSICSKKSISPLEKVHERIEDIKKPKKYLVSDGAGYCKQEICTVDGMAECFICKHFVTSVSCYDSFILKKKKVEAILENKDLGEEIREGYKLIYCILMRYIEAMESVTRKGEIAHA